LDVVSGDGALHDAFVCRLLSGDSATERAAVGVPSLADAHAMKPRGGTSNHGYGISLKTLDEAR
jgi:hypothetical protein